MHHGTMRILVAAAWLAAGCGMSDDPMFGDQPASAGVGAGAAGAASAGDLSSPPVENIVRPSSWPAEGEGERTGVGIAPPGAQDFGEFRGALDRRQIPNLTSLDATGFINEHKIELPEADCGDLICLHGMLGVMGNMITGADCTMLMLGLGASLTDEQLARKPLNLVVAVDVSGSMASAGKLEFARDGLRRMIDALHPDDTVTLIEYSDEAQVLAEAVGQDDWQTLRRQVDRLAIHGGTNLYDGLRAAFEMAAHHGTSQRQSRVIFLSDGQATQGITADELILELARAHTRHGIGLTTIGLGQSFNAALMRGLAEIGSGNYYFLEDAAAVEEVFVEEIEHFVTHVATDLQIVLEAGDAYGLREVFGTSMQEVTGDRAVITFPAVSIAHRRRVEDAEHGRRGGGGALMVELTPHRGWQGLDGIDTERVGRMTLSYTPAAGLGEVGEDGGPVRREQVVEYPFEPGELQPAGFFTGGAAAEKGFVMLNVFVALRIATERANAGDFDSAIAVLDDIDTALVGWLADNTDLDISDDHRIVLQFKDVLRDLRPPAPPAPPRQAAPEGAEGARGADEAEPPWAPTDIWPRD